MEKFHLIQNIVKGSLHERTTNLNDFHILII